MNFNEEIPDAHQLLDQLPSPQLMDEMSAAVTVSPQPSDGSSASAPGAVAACSSSAADVAPVMAPPAVAAAPIKRVCFICGSQTSQTINIYERRAGPNLVEVINAKFKVPPLTEDKFLCYSCNNWLINWYSVQNHQGGSSTPTSPSASSSHSPSAAAAASSSSPSSSSSKSSSSAGCNKPNNRKRNRSIRATVVRDYCPSSIETETKRAPDVDVKAKEMNDDVYYFRGCLQTLELRNKLAMHIHRPKVDDPPSSSLASANNAIAMTTDAVTITKIDRDANIAVKEPQRVVQPASPSSLSSSFRFQSIKCNMCGKPLKLRTQPPCPWKRRPAVVPNPRCVRFCRQCRRATHELYFAKNKTKKKKVNEPTTMTISQISVDKSFVTIVCDPLGDLREEAEGVTTPADGIQLQQQQNGVVNPNVVSRLKRLGTSVVREGDDEEEEEEEEASATRENDEDNEMIVIENRVTSSTYSSLSHLRQSSPLLFSSLSKRPRRNPHHHTSYPSPSPSTQSIAPSMMVPINNPYVIQSPSCWPQSMERNDKNEIVLAFDRTLTEVFPSVSGGSHQRFTVNNTTPTTIRPVDPDQPQGCGFTLTAKTSSASLHSLTTGQQDKIYSRIPKSLSITMLMANS